jgi:hypothetical protein
VLDTAGGGFSGGVTISPDPCVSCGSQGCVYACTSYHVFSNTYSVVFGTLTFSGSENQAASIIGHELRHTAVGVAAGECPAYQWELDHETETGINPCDIGYRDNVNDYLTNPQNECP